MRRFCFFILLALLLAPAAFAQRTAKGQSFVGSSYLISFPGAASGVSLEYGMYLQHSYWMSGAGLIFDSVALSNGLSVDVLESVWSGGWMWRPFWTRSRDVSMYVGGGLLLGAEIYDPAWKLERSRKTLPDGSVLEGGRFIVGIQPSVELEWFFLPKVALTVSLDAPFIFLSRTGVARFCAGAGLRFNI